MKPPHRDALRRRKGFINIKSTIRNALEHPCVKNAPDKDAVTSIGHWVPVSVVMDVAELLILPVVAVMSVSVLLVLPVNR